MQAAFVDHEARLDALIDLQRQKAALAAREQVLLHELATTAPPVTLPGCSDKQWIREELASALRIAPCTAGSRLFTAEQLVTELPATLAALEAGIISFPHALRLCDALEATMAAETVAPDRGLGARAGRGFDGAALHVVDPVCGGQVRPPRHERAARGRARQTAGGVLPARRRHHQPVGRRSPPTPPPRSAT